MTDDIFLITGLGNPGKNYETTRHNIGFMSVDYISNKHNLNLSYNSKFKSEVAHGTISGMNDAGVAFIRKVILCKPLTFMNLSGQSIYLIANYYKIPIDNIIVIHDEIDIGFGNIKTKIGGGSAGHNGIKSIDKELCNKNYHRIRLGIGRPDNSNFAISDYVLSNFTTAELRDIEAIIEAAEKALMSIMSEPKKKSVL